MEVPRNVFGDEVRVRQVLFNLVGNAMKFCDQGGVQIEVSLLPSNCPDKSRVLFCVADTGMGMDEKTLGALGSPFTQAVDGFTRKHQGAGLGLSICKRLVSSMGGTLCFDSAPAEGTCAYLMLPFSVQADFTLPDQPVAVSGAPSLRILLVEDDEICRVAERDLLKRMGHVVRTAENGVEALESMRLNTFDCVLMDVQMEVMDGLEATKNIRKDDSALFDPEIPIIAMTAFAMHGDRERFIMAGMNDYISKPFDYKNLKKILSYVKVKK